MIECRNLSHKYGSHLALDNVSFKVDSAEPVALVGPNGAGKTTLFSILCGYLLPSSGSAFLLDQQAGSTQLLSRVSALPQDAALDPDFSIGEQFKLFAELQGYGPIQARDEVERVLNLVGLDDAFMQKPASLSHGMRKRATIAQALIGEPEIVLLDEPTAGLDPQNAKVIREIIYSVKDKTRFVISSHNLDELERLCDQVLYLDKGQLQQQVSVNSASMRSALELHLAPTDKQQQFIQLSQQISGVEQVVQQSPLEFAIRYDDKTNPFVDRDLLIMMAEHQFQYRKLHKGERLEQRLFSDD